MAEVVGSHSRDSVTLRRPLPLLLALKKQAVLLWATTVRATGDGTESPSRSRRQHLPTAGQKLRLSVPKTKASQAGATWVSLQVDASLVKSLDENIAQWMFWLQSGHTRCSRHTSAVPGLLAHRNCEIITACCFMVLNKWIYILIDHPFGFRVRPVLQIPRLRCSAGALWIILTLPQRWISNQIYLCFQVISSAKNT